MVRADKNQNRMIILTKKGAENFCPYGLMPSKPERFENRKWRLGDTFQVFLSLQKLPCHILHDAAVPVVFNFHLRIQAGNCFEFDDASVFFLCTYLQ